ncbi:hypothetical protein BUALT_Bualt19G0007200 [Buddleja alternifolia]|uniref:RING-type domain-containing protein n=1 Tax=Buddleja alternifolia TaxID=168488 RepID=A0AAV6W8B4_9LAMI|nr:hypothetical protein BUALT_Bualt19G0007200 [Buddleja alternifolia]
MVETSDQVRPLAPASDRTTAPDDEEIAVTKNRRRRLLKCCGCATALLLILAIIIIIILIFTVFRIKDPIIRMNNVAVQRLDLITGTTTPRPGSNITLNADVSVKNPNFASFRYRNTTTAIFYRGAVIGEARGPPGRAKARRTMRMNITVDVMTDRVLSQPDFGSDLGSGLLPLSSYTQVGGRVKILIVRKHLTVRMNCSVTVNITSRTIQQQRCRRKNPNPDENSVYLPRVIFVAEDDDSDSQQNVVVGLDQAVINSYPKLVFSKRSGGWGNDAVCSICLCEYREAEMLRMLPDCKHCFHVMCVDAWLKLNASCPVCRNSPLPTPLSTPLQEVVPLSQYSDGRRRQ